MVVIRLQSQTAFAKQLLGSRYIISPTLKYGYSHDRSTLRTTHMLPVHRWTGVQDHSVLQAGNDLSRRQYIHQNRIGGDNPIERFGVGGLYLFLDVDGYQLLGIQCGDLAWRM